MIDEKKISIYKRDPVRFLEDHYFIGRGKRIKFEDWQREEILLPLLYTKNINGQLVKHTDVCPCGSGRTFGLCCIGEYPRWFNEALIGLPKKNGKSELAAALAFYELFFGDCPEIYFISNSREQTRSLSFDKLKKAIERNRRLRSGLTIQAGMIENPANGGTVKTLSHSAGTVAGLNPSFVHFDELWNFQHTESERVFSELTLSPARTESLNIVTSYAGYRRGGVLWNMYERGRAGNDARFFFYWQHENRASWVTLEYLAQQRARLPEPVYKRLHENRWSASGGFISDEMLQRAITPGLKYGGERGGSVGLDLGLRRDRTALARVVSDHNGNMRLADLKVYKGTRADEVNIEVVESELLRQFEHGGAHQALFDPWQLQSSRQRLQARVPIREYPFTAASVQRLAQAFYEVLAAGRLSIPDDSELIAEIRGLQLIETANGWKFDHVSGAHDDRCVAIALAVVGELEKPAPRTFEEIMADLETFNADMPSRESDFDPCDPWSDDRGDGFGFDGNTEFDHSEMDVW